MHFSSLSTLRQRRESNSPSRRKRVVRTANFVTLAIVTAALIFSGAGPSQAVDPLPCDIYATAGAPCVAAHSTTRALYTNYVGSLYRVSRASDGAGQDIGLLSTGGYSNAATQDTFCAGTTCLITKIYDQSPRHNDLTIEGSGGAGSADVGAPADALPVIAGGHSVYGIEFSGQMGYRDNTTSGVAVGGQPEGMYMVTSGTHVNGSCCMDYGNAETNNLDTGNGHMDAINFGTERWFAGAAGNGPWVQADLENGLFQSSSGGPVDNTYTGDASPFVTAILENNGQNHFAIKSGNAQTGALTTRYSGSEPTGNGGGYSPMHQEGAIVLGTGGDNSNGSIGSFFEGVMTAGVPTDAADSAVQANVVSVGYGGPTGVSGSLGTNSEISLNATTPGYAADFIRHQNNTVVLSNITAASSALDRGDATFIVRPGLASSSCVSFESRNFPGDFLRHYNFQLFKQPMDGSASFRADATFCPRTGANGHGASFQSYNYPTKYLRHYNGTLYIASNSGSNAWDNTTSWANDVSFIVSTPLAP